jgi:ABC-type Fe3+-hydroxamate transport system substrate-binding protein
VTTRHNRIIEIADDMARTVRLPQPARRIVSLVPSLTEGLFVLGCGAAVIGVTRYCTEPSVMPEHVHRVGGTRNPSLPDIEALQPDLVLVNAEENRKEDFEVLERKGLTVFVTFPRRAGDTPDLLRRLGDLTGTSATAQELAGEVLEALAQCKGRESGRRPRVFCPIWTNPWMSFNRDTYADDMLWQAGGDNLCRDRRERYCHVTLEQVAAAAPEIIVLPDEPYVFAQKDLPALAALRDTPAGRQNRVHFIDGKLLSWYGPRTAEGLRYLRRLLCGDLRSADIGL